MKIEIAGQIKGKYQLGEGQAVEMREARQAVVEARRATRASTTDR